MRNVLVVLAMLAGGAGVARADEVTMPDGSKWLIADGKATYKNITLSEIRSFRSNVGCASGLRGTVNSAPAYLPSGWFTRENIATTSAVVNACHETAGVLVTMKIIWTGALDPADHGAIASALSMIGPFSESEPVVNVALFDPTRYTVPLSDATGIWMPGLLKENAMAIRLVWPMPANPDLIGQGFISVNRAAEVIKCHETQMRGAPPSWASSAYVTGSQKDGSSQACLNPSDGVVVGVGMLDAQAAEDMPYVKAMVAAIGSSVGGGATGGLTLGPATGQLPPPTTTGTITPPAPVTPTTPTDEPDYVPTKPSLLKMFDFSGQLLLPEDQSTENGFGAAIGFRKGLHFGMRAAAFIEGELSYNTVGNISGGAMFGFTSRLVPFFRIEAGIGYDGIGFGEERMTTNVVVDDNLIYGGLAALDGGSTSLSFGYYGRNDDIVSYELRAQLEYFTGSGRTLFVRLTSFENACNIFSLGFSP